MGAHLFLRTILISGIIVACSTCGYAQTRSKGDPFKSKLPQEEQQAAPSATADDTYGDLLTQIHKINLEGIIWCDAFAAAIINGGVYSKGDTIKDLNAKIVDIKKGKVMVSYKGRTYTLLKE